MQGSDYRGSVDRAQRLSVYLTWNWSFLEHIPQTQRVSPSIPGRVPFDPTYGHALVLILRAHAGTLVGSPSDETKRGRYEHAARDFVEWMRGISWKSEVDLELQGSKKKCSEIVEKKNDCPDVATMLLLW
jgi:hypothetical protein